MALPDIQFEQIREHEGSRDRAFEELCCQLAALDPRPDDSVFYRKGRGRDAGLECFFRRPDGTECGWQAKYFWKMDANLTRSLSDSLDSALQRHPYLTTFIVCIPFDLSNPGGSEDPGAIGKWRTWKEKREAQAQAEGRTLVIDLWSASTIKERLTRSGALGTGRILFWFNKQLLSSDWCKAKLITALADLGNRYTAESHVDLPIRRALLGLSRDPALWRERQTWTKGFQRFATGAVRTCTKLEPDAEAPLPCDLSGAIEELQTALEARPPEPCETSPIPEWKRRLAKAKDAVAQTFRWWMDHGCTAGGDEETQNKARYWLSELENRLETIAEALNDPLWQHVDDRAVVITGEGGVGKSHLLADVAQYQIDKGRPAVLLLGQHFTDGDPWPQIIGGLDLPTGTTTDDFLGALDAAAEGAGVRGLLIIDALNEKHGLDLWPDRLAGLLHKVQGYPHLAVVLSCRTTFLSRVLPDTLDEDRLPRLEHPGFRPEDARAYLKARGFVLPGTPVPAPEFSNPLFLRTCCDTLERDGVQEFPKGLHGATNIFKFYLEAVSRQVDGRLGLSTHRRVVQKAVDALAKRMADRLSDYLPMEETLTSLDHIQTTNGGLRGELLEELTSEGLLSAEVQGDNADNDHVVRFTFQRFSDHMIAASLLDRYVEGDDPTAAFSEGGPLHAYLAGEPSWRMAGVVEALAVQLPERYGREIMDFAPDAHMWPLSHAFEESLLWRDQRTFTRRTLDLVQEIFGLGGTMDILLRIATEPDNEFNADFLDEKLQSLPMPERDAFWSIPVAEHARDDEAAYWTLVDWVWTGGFGQIEDRRAELASVALTWFLTTSHRPLRDRATKALATLFAPRGWLMHRLLERFWAVDDDYLRERLLAAIYGGTLQGFLNREELEGLTTEVYMRLFADGAPPPNTLLRDHGRWLVEYALSQGGCPESVDIAKVRPPYQSPWPLEIVPDDIIEGYTATYPSGATLTDDIVRSTVKDGDFARYIIDPYISHWSAAPIGVKRLPSPQDIAKEWKSDFDCFANVDTQERYSDVLKCRKALDNLSRRDKTPEREAYDLALKRFQEALSSEQWEDYRTRAGEWWADGMFNGSASRELAIFNLSWARRWVCMRAHDLGWSEELHNDFDSGRLPSRDRRSNAIERIGKKYQWMALYELGARLADNRAFIGDRWGAKEPAPYDGECFGTLRDLDPSLLIRRSYDDGWTTFPEPTWWAPILPRLESTTTEERFIWMYGDDGFIDDSQCLDLTDPDDRRWLTLQNFLSVREWSSGGDSLQRETSSRISCFVVPRDDLPAALEALKHQSLIDPRAVPSLDVSGHQTYFGEYPWHPVLEDLPDWFETETYPALPYPTRATAGTYTCAQGDFDYSLDNTIRVAIPAPWLCDHMGLHLSDGKAATYVDDGGFVRFWDPSLSEKGPHAGLVDRAAFLSVLADQNLAAVWVIAGEKGVYGGSMGSMTFGGRTVFTTLYTLEDGVWKQQHYRTLEAPTREQVEPMFQDGVPDWIQLRLA